MYNNYLSPYQTQQYQNYNNNIYQNRGNVTGYDMPFQDIKYTTKEQAMAYIAMPNTSALLIDRQNKIAYISSTNYMGEPSKIAYKYEKIDIDKPNIERPKEIDTSNFLTQDNTKEFVKKEDLKTIEEKLDYLEKQIKINNILNGEDKKINEG